MRKIGTDQRGISVRNLVYGFVLWWNQKIWVFCFKDFLLSKRLKTRVFLPKLLALFGNLRVFEGHSWKVTFNLLGVCFRVEIGWSSMVDE